MDYYKQVAIQPFLQQAMLPRHAALEQQVQRRRRFVSSVVSSGLAGATSTTLLYPFEFLRTRLAMDVGKYSHRQYTGMLDVVRQILHSDGVLGFFQGYGIALGAGVAYRIMYLGGYDALKDQIVYWKQDRAAATDKDIDSETKFVLSWSERFFSAQFISLTAGTIVYPFDSVRRRLMMQAGQARAERAYRNAWHCVVVVFRTEGMRGFYRGIGPNLVRSVGGALLLVAYDGLLGLLQK